MARCAHVCFLIGSLEGDCDRLHAYVTMYTGPDFQRGSPSSVFTVKQGSQGYISDVAEVRGTSRIRTENHKKQQVAPNMPCGHLLRLTRKNGSNLTLTAKRDADSPDRKLWT